MSPITISRLILALSRISDREAEALLQERVQDLTALSRVIEHMREAVIAVRGRKVLSASPAGIRALGLQDGSLSRNELLRDLTDFLSHASAPSAASVIMPGADGQRYTVAWSSVETLDEKGALLVWLIPLPQQQGSTLAEERSAARDAGLSKREAEVIVLLSQGKLNKEIAYGMKLSCETVRTYVKRIYRKLDVTGRIEAINALRRSDDGTRITL